VVICGYDDMKKHYVMRNSWGNSWGENGYFFLPYPYIESNLCSDMWVLTSIQHPAFKLASKMFDA